MICFSFSFKIQAILITARPYHFPEFWARNCLSSFIIGLTILSSKTWIRIPCWVYFFEILPMTNLSSKNFKPNICCISLSVLGWNLSGYYFVLYKNTLTFSLIMYSKCVRSLTGQAPKLTGKCLVTGCYYKNWLYNCKFSVNQGWPAKYPWKITRWPTKYTQSNSYLQSSWHLTMEFMYYSSWGLLLSIRSIRIALI